MGVVEHSNGAVESHLSTLEDAYGAFSVNQTTIPVPPAQYDRERERAADGRVDLYAKVWNDQSEVLYRTDGDDMTLPSTAAEGPRALEDAVCTAIAEKTGIDCTVTGVEEVTILGVRDAENEDRDTVCRLAILFEATDEGGTAGEAAEWRPPSEVSDPVYI